MTKYFFALLYISRCYTSSFLYYRKQSIISSSSCGVDFPVYKTGRLHPAVDKTCHQYQSYVRLLSIISTHQTNSFPVTRAK
jgi:hypothetical protein